MFDSILIWFSFRWFCVDQYSVMSFSCWLVDVFCDLACIICSVSVSFQHNLLFCPFLSWWARLECLWLLRVRPLCFAALFAAACFWSAFTVIGEMSLVSGTLCIFRVNKRMHVCLGRNECVQRNTWKQTFCWLNHQFVLIRLIIKSGREPNLSILSLIADTLKSQHASPGIALVVIFSLMSYQVWSNWFLFILIKFNS